MMQFEKGQKVRARESVQGMVAGCEYLVSEVESLATPFGVFVTYYLGGPVLGNGQLIAVGNGHLLLDLVKETS
jgi:hypothetical protein